METCLATTGTDISFVIEIAVILVVIGSLLLVKYKKRAITFGIAVLIAGLIPFSSANPSYAATTCQTKPPISSGATTTNDFRNTTYTLGASISLDILANDPGSENVDRSTIDLQPNVGGVQSTTISQHGAWQHPSGSSVVNFAPSSSTDSSGDTIQYQYRYNDGSLGKITDVTIVATAATAPAAPVAADDYLEPFCHFSYFGSTSPTVVKESDCLDGVYSPTQSVWTIKLLTSNDTISSPANYDFSTVDIDPAVPGIQQNIVENGFTATYDPATDDLTIAVTDIATYTAYQNAINGSDFSNTAECEAYNDMVATSSVGTGCHRSAANDTVLTYTFGDTYGSQSNIAAVHHRGVAIVAYPPL